MELKETVGAKESIRAEDGERTEAWNKKEEIGGKDREKIAGIKLTG